MVVSTLKKALKVLGILFFIIFAVALSLALSRYFQNKPQVFPYPYTSHLEFSEEELNLASSSDILLIGDTLGVHYDQYLSRLVYDLSSGLEKKLKFYNWSKVDEPLHITLNKLKALSNIPSLVIYHGGVNEFKVKRMEPEHIETFSLNYELTKNEWLYSLVIAFPTVGRILYSPYKHLPLTSQTPDYSQSLKAKSKEQVKEFTHILHSQEAHDLVTYLKEHHSKGILITAPLNLRDNKVMSCENTTNVGINKRLLVLEKQIKQGNSKLVITELENLARETLANSKVFYLLGQARYQLGNYIQARKAFHRAKIYDCSLGQGNLLFNISLVRHFESAGFPIIDFHQMIQQYFGKEELFEVRLFPKPQYYNEVNMQLKTLIQQHFQFQ